MLLGEGVTEKLRRVNETDDVAFTFRSGLDELDDARDNRGKRDGLVAIPEDVMIGGHRAPASDGAEFFKLLHR